MATVALTAYVAKQHNVKTNPMYGRSIGTARRYPPAISVAGMPHSSSVLMEANVSMLIGFVMERKNVVMDLMNRKNFAHKVCPSDVKLKREP